MVNHKRLANALNRGYPVGIMTEQISPWPTVDYNAPLYPIEVAEPLQRLFAAAMLRNPDDPWKAVREVEPDHHAKQYWILTHWKEHPVVIAERDRLLALQGPLARVPTKEQFALEVYQAGNDAKSHGDKMSAWKFFAELMDYTQKSGAGNTINFNQQNNNVTNRIMAVPLAASDDEWERTALAHQKKLQINHG